MSTLAELTDRIEQYLLDNTNAIFSTDVIEEGLRLALDSYSKVRPLAAVTTVSLSADSHELDISSITGLVDVTECWTPYTAADPEHPPNRRAFNYWRDLDTLYFPDYELQSGETLRVFYIKRQTIEDLDSGTSTTVPAEDESLLVIGASCYVASSREIDLSEQVTIDNERGEAVRKWGLDQCAKFHIGLEAVAKAQAAGDLAIVTLPKLDKWDKDFWT